MLLAATRKSAAAPRPCSDHHFEKLNEHQIYCPGCGDIRTAPGFVASPVFVTPPLCWCGQHHYGSAHPWWQTGITWSDSGSKTSWTVSTGNVSSSDNVLWLSSGSGTE